jgi:hypothetical protein
VDVIADPARGLVCGLGCQIEYKMWRYCEKAWLGDNIIVYISDTPKIH